MVLSPSLFLVSQTSPLPDDAEVGTIDLCLPKTRKATIDRNTRCSGGSQTAQTRLDQVYNNASGVISVSTIPTSICLSAVDKLDTSLQKRARRHEATTGQPDDDVKQ